MPELPTVEIHSWKQPEVKWVINASEYDEKVHKLWGTMSESDMEEATEAIEDAAEAEELRESDIADAASEDAGEPQPDDIVHDRQGNAVALYVVNPDDRRARMRIAVNDYDPDVHTLWSHRFK